MAKLRRNHHRNGAGGGMFRIILFSVFLFGILYLGYPFIEKIFSDLEETTVEGEIEGERYYLPLHSKGQIIHHDFYSLSYFERYEIPEWVAYDLTREELNLPKVPRSNYFNPDYQVKSRSAFHRDYTHSGYTRGHLAPAADMAFDERAMEQSFYMSNITPQKRAFNNGIWRELEEQTRDWARKFKRLYITTGPLLDRIEDRIGENRVGVPHAFFKALLDIDDPEKKGIAFIIPNDLSDRPLSEYAVSIDSVEQLTGLDIFGELIDERLASEVETSFDISLWPFHPQRFRWRVEEWNHQ